jgi:hypothetical protein
LAAAGDTLFALTGNGKDLNSAKLYRQDPDGSWPKAPVLYPPGYTGTEYPYLQSLYGAGDTVFLGGYRTRTDSQGRKMMSYGILSVEYRDGDPQGYFRQVFSFSDNVPGQLSGAYYEADSNTFYLASGAGLYALKEEAGADPVIEMRQAGNFMRLLPIEIEGTKSLLGIIRVSGGNDHIWYGSFSGGALSVRFDGAVSAHFTSAAGVWENPDAAAGGYLLLLGRGRNPSQVTTSYTYGYYEVTIENGLVNTSFDRHVPGSKSSADTRPTTVDSNAQYASSLGTRGINSIFQAPRDIDPDMPIFASTQKDGLWSLRYEASKGRREWNVED